MSGQGDTLEREGMAHLVIVIVYFTSLINKDEHPLFFLNDLNAERNVFSKLMWPNR